MADTRSPDGLAQAEEDPPATTGSLIRRRRGLRVILVSLASVALLLGAVTAGGYAYVNHALSSIRRVPVGFLVKDDPADGETILLTSSQLDPTGHPSVKLPSDDTGLIMLLHISADGRGGVVPIPADTVVSVPGYGQTQLMNAIALGGPSLLTETVAQLTSLPINHYARIDFNRVADMINAIGGVQVTLPRASESSGHWFPQGVDHINGLEGILYARDPSLTEHGRTLRQQSLIRAVFDKLATQHMLTSPLTMYHVLNALTGMLTVDSTLTNSGIEDLAGQLGGLHGSTGTFITAPTVVIDGTRYLNTDVCDELWSAISQDALAAFARDFPRTVTPQAVP